MEFLHNLQEKLTKQRVDNPEKELSREINKRYSGKIMDMPRIYESLDDNDKEFARNFAEKIKNLGGMRSLPNEQYQKVINAIKQRRRRAMHKFLSKKPTANLLERSNKYYETEHVPFLAVIGYLIWLMKEREKRGLPPLEN